MQWCSVSRKKGSRQRWRQASNNNEKEKKNQTIKQKQTTDKNIKLPNGKNTIHPTTANVQLSTLHCRTVTDWNASRICGVQKGNAGKSRGREGIQKRAQYSRGVSTRLLENQEVKIKVRCRKNEACRHEARKNNTEWTQSWAQRRNKMRCWRRKKKYCESED